MPKSPPNLILPLSNSAAFQISPCMYVEQQDRVGEPKVLIRLALQKKPMIRVSKAEDSINWDGPTKNKTTNNEDELYKTRKLKLEESKVKNTNYLNEMPKIW